MKIKECVMAATLFSLISAFPLKADTLYLKNGRAIDGIIQSEEANSVELEVSGGTIRFSKDEINEIVRSSTDETRVLREEWKIKKAETQKLIEKQAAQEASRPREAGFSNDRQGMVVKVLLNKKVEAALLLDTGASLVMIRKRAAKELGYDLSRLKGDTKLIAVGGRQLWGKRIVLQSLKVEKTEAYNVEAVILLEDVGEGDMYDGLLGMSFLNKFNFKIDQKDNRLILEKL